FGALPRSTRPSSSSSPSVVQKVPSGLASVAAGSVQEVRAKAPTENPPPAKNETVAVQQHLFTDPAAVAVTDAGLLRPSQQKSSRRYHASRKPRMNKKCAYSFIILLGVGSVFVMGGVL